MKTNKKEYTQSTIYEFVPDENVTVPEIIELSKLIRIGVSGEILDKASYGLKRHFVEVVTKAA